MSNKTHSQSNVANASQSRTSDTQIANAIYLAVFDNRVLTDTQIVDVYSRLKDSHSAKLSTIVESLIDSALIERDATNRRAFVATRSASDISRATATRRFSQCFTLAESLSAETQESSARKSSKSVAQKSSAVAESRQSSARANLTLAQRVEYCAANHADKTVHARHMCKACYRSARLAHLLTQETNSEATVTVQTKQEHNQRAHERVARKSRSAAA